MDKAYFCCMLKDNIYRKKRLIRSLLGVAALVATLYSCASMGRPDGGPFDETPPRFIGSTPAAGAVNTKKSKIVLDFDEFIKLEKASEKVVVSPPQLQQPEIKPGGKRITVNLLDSLKPNTTYTIDFSDAIVDNNEGNPLGNFAFTFSTGASIDTMEVSGTLLEASDLEPIKGMLVGLHSNLNDSAFTKLPFDRVARTDSRGHFTIRGIAPGKYRIFGLMDADQNFFYNQKGEAVAFNDSLIIPRFEERIRQDTAWVDSLTIDTIVEQKYTYFLPDNIVLRSFKKPSVSQYLVKSERLTPNKFSLYFSAPADSLPVLKGLNFDEKDAFVIEKTFRNDTIHYWILASGFPIIIEVIAAHIERIMFELKRNVGPYRIYFLAKMNSRTVKAGYRFFKSHGDIIEHVHRRRSVCVYRQELSRFRLIVFLLFLFRLFFLHFLCGQP